MPRFSRFVQPGVPYHVTHCGNRQQDIFMCEADRAAYRELLREYSAKAGLAIWAYCWMTNHVHLLVVPSREDSLASGVGLAHWRFARRQNAAYHWSGHLFQGRFYSCALDPGHVWTAVRYIERNPVRARLVSAASEWHWSSARCHATAEPDDLLAPERPFPGPVPDWAAWLSLPPDEAAEARLRRATSTGRPCGEQGWVKDLERQAGRPLAPRPSGRKPMARDVPGQTDMFTQAPERG